MSTNQTTRRVILGSAVAFPASAVLSSPTSVAAGNTANAPILALEQQVTEAFDRLIATCDKLNMAERQQSGVKEAEALNFEAVDEVDRLMVRVCETPATTLAGIYSKVRISQINPEIEDGIGDSIIRDLLSIGFDGASSLT